MSHSELQYTPCLFGKTKRIFILLETKDFSVSTDFISASLSVLEKEIVWVLPLNPGLSNLRHIGMLDWQ